MKPNNSVKFSIYKPLVIRRELKEFEREQKERQVLDELISKIENQEEKQELKSLNISSKFKTIWQKLETFETTNEGKVKLPLVLEEKDGKYEPKVFVDMQEYSEWKIKKLEELKDAIFKKLSPMEYYITQGKGTERPFTGEYWDCNKVGVYACKVCTQRIFRYFKN